MKVNIIEVPTPMFSSFTMCAKPDINILKETKTITIEASPKTKTRVSTGFKLGECSMRIDWKVEGVKQFSEDGFSYLDNTHHTSHYFVKSKKQGYDSYKDYVEIVVKMLLNKFNVELDEINVRLINHNAF